MCLNLCTYQRHFTSSLASTTQPEHVGLYCRYHPPPHCTPFLITLSMYFSYWNTKDMICTMTFSASASLSTSPMPRARSSASTAGSLTLALPHDNHRRFT